MQGSAPSMLELFRALWPTIVAFIGALAWLFRQLNGKVSKKELKDLSSQLATLDINMDARVLKCSCKDYRDACCEDRKTRFGSLEIELREMRKEFRSGLDGLTSLIVKHNGG